MYHRAGRRAIVTGVAVFAVGLFAGWALLPGVTAMPTSLGGGTGGTIPSVKFASFAACAGEYVSCSTRPAVGDPAKEKYLVIVFIHGPMGATGSVADSLGDRFHLLSTCWLDNGVFGHTAIFVSNATVRTPKQYYVNLTPPTGEEAYMKVALAYNQGTNDRIDVFSNTCDNHWTEPSNRTLPTTYDTSLSGDLTIYLWVLGQANGSSAAVTCGKGTTIMMSCGSPVSGPSYNKGLSFPAFARETFSSSGAETASIKISGGGCAKAACPWDVSYLALTADPPPKGGQ